MLRRGLSVRATVIRDAAYDTALSSTGTREWARVAEGRPWASCEPACSELAPRADFSKDRNGAGSSLTPSEDKSSVDDTESE